MAASFGMWSSFIVLLCISPCFGVDYIRKNEGLTQFPNDIWPNATLIDLTDNNIAELSGFPTLASVKTLKALNNKLTAFPDLTGIATTLEVLDLNKNQMTQILPSRLDRLVKLRSLVVSNNKLTEIPDVSGPANTLRVLRFTNNLVPKFPVLTLLGSKLLYDINAHTNPISEISDAAVKALPYLQKLYLTSCDIKNISSIATYGVNLQRLFIESNEVDELPEDIFHLKDLYELRVRYNKIETVPNICRRSGIGPLSFELTGNPIKCDCRVMGLKVAMDKGDVITMDTVAGPTKCSAPAHLAGREIQGLSIKEMECEDSWRRSRELSFQRSWSRDRCGDANITQIVTSTSVTECGLICKKTPGCYSFGFQSSDEPPNSKNGTCAITEHNTSGAQDWHLFDEKYSAL